MRYFLMTVLSLCCIAALTACGNRTQENETPAFSETPQISENVTAEDSTESEAIQGEVSEMRVKLTQVMKQKRLPDYNVNYEIQRLLSKC